MVVDTDAVRQCFDRRPFSSAKEIDARLDATLPAEECACEEKEDVSITF